MRRHFPRHRGGAVAVLFAAMVIPVLGLVGLAIDYGIWNESYQSLSLAASAAALNAAKTAASAKAQSDSNYLTEGATSGKQWFLAEIGQGSYAVAAVTTTTPLTVNVTSSAATVTATVTFTSTVRSVFGRLFKRATYPITITTAATMSAGTYVEVVMMLDNSSSMDIGASTSDMMTLMQQSPCYTTNEFTRTSSNSTYSQTIAERYEIYQYTWAGGTYDGLLTPLPIKNGSLTFDYATAEASEPQMAQYCGPAQVSAGLCSHTEQCPSNVNGYPAYAGPPCAFACHSDTSGKKAGLGTDLWTMARQAGVTLRLDLVKNATNLILNAMKSDNIASLNNLSVGVYAFNNTVTPIYPTGCTPQAFGCEAGSNWTTALSAVGLPPQTAGVYTETGFEPAVAPTASVNDDTEVEETMSTLASTYVTAAGDGSAPTKPKKVLILITDGLEDDPTGPGISGLRQAMPSSVCTPFKNMGYTVYVVETPYTPLMHTWYLTNGIPIAEGTGPNSISANLLACATNATDYQSATSQSQINTALLTFLTNALSTPATFIR